MAQAADLPVAPPVTVTATRLPASEFSVGQSVLVIPESEIRERAPVALPDVIRGLSAIHTDQPGAPGGFSALYLRGADPSHTVILIDGVKVSDPTNQRGGGIDLSHIDARTIARVEVLPGASSALYGADAMAGVVNIITRAPDRSGARLRAGAGGDGFRNAYASGTFVSSGVGLTAEAAAMRDGETSDAGSARLRTGSLRLCAGVPGERSLSGWMRMQHHESNAFPEDSGGPLFAVRRTQERRENDGFVGAISGETRTPWGSLRLYANTFAQESDIDSPGVAAGIRDPAGLPRSVTATRYRRSAGGAIAVFGTGAHAPALIGAQYEKEEGESASTLFLGPLVLPANFALDRQTRSVFGEGRLEIGDALSLQAGVRADRMALHGTRTTYQLGARYRASPSAPSFAASYGTGFKPPSFFALGHPLVGNPALAPEESRTAELSISSEEGSASRPSFGYRVALFRSEYENLIDFDPGPPARLVNRSQVTITGYEASAAARVTDRARLRASVTGLSFDLPPEAPPLRSRPRFRASAAATYAITAEWSASLFGSWVGRAFDSSIPTGGTYLSPYLLLDASVVYAARGMRLALAFDNLLDRDYQQFIGFPGRGRRARVEVALDM